MLEGAGDVEVYSERSDYVDDVATALLTCVLSFLISVSLRH